MAKIDQTNLMESGVGPQQIIDVERIITNSDL